MTREEKLCSFRELHTRPGIFVVPNPWNAGTAKILTALGFEALATTSAGYAFAAGKLDSSAALGREEILANAKEVVDATELPVSADLENGFGHSPAECAKTMRMAAAVGLVGGSIEDASGDPNNPIYEFTQAVERVSAAARAARDCEILLTARTENFLWGRPDLLDTIERLRAFGQAGADVLYAPGLPSLEAIREVCSSVGKPVNVVMGLTGPSYSLDELAVAGVKRVSVGGSLARAALGGFMRAAREIKNTGTFEYCRSALPHSEARRLMAASQLSARDI